MEEKTGSISISELMKLENISVRSYNVCHVNNLKDIDSILNYYKLHGDFKGLWSCGVITNLELTELCRKYEDGLIVPPGRIRETIPAETSFTTIDSLSAAQKNVLNVLVKDQFKLLSNRTRKALKTHLGYVTIENIRLYRLSKGSDLKRYRNIGYVAMDEIDQFLNKVRYFTEQIKHSDNPYVLVGTKIKLREKRLLSLDFISLPIMKDMYSISGRLPIFKILHEIIENRNLMTFEQRLYFKTRLNYYNNNKRGDITIENETTFPLEKSIQLGKILSNPSHLFFFLKELKANDIHLYGVDCTSPCIKINDELVATINKAENTNFSRVFIARILSVILSDTHLLASYNNKSDNRPGKEQNIYLISIASDDKFNFSQFMRDVNIRLTSKIPINYSLNFEAYLQSFTRDASNKVNSDTVQVATILLESEFNKNIVNGNICFRSKASKTITDYIIEAFEYKDDPVSC